MSETERLISPDKRGEDVDASLRPQSLDEFTGQAEARANLKVFIEAAKGAAKRSTMCCSSDLRDWARPRWRKSWQRSWA
jgi:hypothetical protein